MKKAPETESQFIKHIPCEQCGSSDGNALYSDGHECCFVCGAYKHGDGEVRNAPTPEEGFVPLKFDSAPLTSRKISEKTASLFQYGRGVYKGMEAAIANIYGTDGRTVVAQKIRMANKHFAIIGNSKKAGLFGQHLWRDGGKRIIITEGLEDAMAMSQVQGNSWPVVSLVGGAQGAYKELQRNLDWIQRFETVVLMFDMDEAGQEAAQKCATLFKPRQCAIASLPEKDACDMLKTGQVKGLIDAMWNAKTYRPPGIVNACETWEEVKNFRNKPSYEIPFTKVNEMLSGLHDGEILTIVAGSGIGKSLIARTIAYSMLDQVEGIGYIALEESHVRSVQGFMGLYLQKPIHQGYGEISEDKLKEAFDATVGSGKVYLTDHWGSLDKHELIDKIRYLIKGCGCDLIVLDHISIVVSGTESGDERKDIDVLMTNLRTVVEETQCKMILVSHLKRPEGKKGHEDGVQTSLSHLRGSGAIAQLSDAVLAGERNQQDKKMKDITLFRILKNRLTGETGEAGYALYTKETGLLTNIDDAIVEGMQNSKGVAGLDYDVLSDESPF